MEKNFIFPKRLVSNVQGYQMLKGREGWIEVHKDSFSIFTCTISTEGMERFLFLLHLR